MGCSSSRDVEELSPPEDVERTAERPKLKSLRPLMWALKFASLEQQFIDATDTLEAFTSAELQEFEPQFVDSPELTPTELEWIVKVRDAAMSSDFAHLCSCAMLVQLAIVTHGDGTLAVQRLAKLSKWYSEPSVASKSPADCLDEVVPLVCPNTGHGWGVPLTLKDGTIGLSADYTNFDFSNAPIPLCIKSSCYFFDLCACSLNNVRRGISVVGNMSGGMKSISPQHELAYSRLYTAGYPISVRNIILVDSSRLVKFSLKVLIPLIGETQRKKFVTLSAKEAFDEYLSKETTPACLGGNTGPTEAKASLASMREKRAAWENELAEKYGENFSKI